MVVVGMKYWTRVLASKRAMQLQAIQWAADLHGCGLLAACCLDKARHDNSACGNAGDVIYTNMPTQGANAPIPNVQYFWEAFPSGSGAADRTTYLFTYLDADTSRSVRCMAWLLHAQWRRA